MCNSEPMVESLKKLMADATRFESYIETKYAKLTQNEKIRRTHEKGCQTKAALKHNDLNRYCDILPYDDTRVVLSNPKLGQSDDDYINANYVIAPFGVHKSYIATQGPIKKTVIDFWRMVVENDSPVIVCLTSEIENNKKKCEKYWPSPDKALELENEKVKLKVYLDAPERRDTDADCIVREIMVEFYQNETAETAEVQLLEKHKVVQLQFLAWADHGVPKDTTRVLNLIELARQLMPNDQLPMVVHCSAGCGRTGTFCVIDIAEALLRTNPRAVGDPILQITNEIRRFRTTMVQTESQFEFCYKALIDFMARESKPTDSDEAEDEPVEGTQEEKGN